MKSAQELDSLFQQMGEAYADSVELEAPVPALEEPRDALENSKILHGPTEWWEAGDEATDASAETYVSLSSLDMDIRTIRRRIAKFLEADDYHLTKIGNRVIFNIQADMVGYITRRLY